MRKFNAGPMIAGLAVALGIGSLAGAEVTKEAQAQLDKVAGFYDALKSFEVEGLLTIEQMGEKQEITFVAAREDGKYMRKVSLGGELMDHLAIDGKNFSYYFSQAGMYVTEPWTETLADVASYDQGGEMLTLNAFITGDLLGTMLEGVESATIAERAEGATATTVTMTKGSEQMGNVTLDMVIADGDKPHIQSVEMKPVGAPVTFKVDYKNWKTNIDVADEVFSFTAPEGAQVNAKLRQMVGMAPPMKAGGPAPEFEIVLMDGAKKALASHKGKEIVILDFWATWCPPCRAAMPVLAEVAGEYAAKGVVTYAVNVAEEDDVIAEFLKQQTYKLTVAKDPQGEIAASYGANSIPRTVIIDKDGTIQAIHEGFAPDYGDKLCKELDTLLAGNKLAKN